MSAIGMEAITEYRGMGHSSPKASRKSIEPKVWLGCRLYDSGCATVKAGDATGHAGDHLHGLCGCNN